MDRREMLGAVGLGLVGGGTAAPAGARSERRGRSG